MITYQHNIYYIGQQYQLSIFKYLLLCSIISQVWTANIVSTSADKKEFVLSNKQWTADVNAGSELKVDFNGRAPGDSVPSATIYIEGVDKAPSGGQSSGGGSGTGTGGTPTQGTNTGGGGHETAAPYTGAGMDKYNDL